MSVAQQSAPSPSVTTSDQDMAKSVRNPIEDFVKAFIEGDVDFRIGPKQKSGLSLSLEPLFPFQITNQCDLMIRPNETVTYLPSPHEQIWPQRSSDVVLSHAARGQ